MTAGTTDETLRRLIEKGRSRAQAIGTEHGMLWAALSDATEGGKRFRPALLTATHDALNGTADAAAAAVGAAVELLHTAFVIHDDVIDGDLIRRGRPNVSGTFRAAALSDGATVDQAGAYGAAAGILAGDLALATAIRAVATCGAPAATVHRLLDLFDLALHTSASGELADVRLSHSPAAASLAESLAMEAQKTSAYSFVLPLQAGAVLADADDSTVERLGAAGHSLGIAFQLVDDLIGVFGDPEQTGKSAISDLRGRKQTPLIVHARSTSEWAQIAPHLGRDLEVAELDEVRRLLTAAGSRRFVEQLAARELAAARGTLDELGIATDLLAGLSLTAGPTAAPTAGGEVAA